MSGSIYVRRRPDGTWVAELSDVPVQTNGATREDAIEGARRAFADYREILERRGASEHLRGIDPSGFEVRDQAAGPLPEDLEVLEEHDLRDFLHQLEAIRAEVIATIASLDGDRIERKPREGMWSVREALEHIAQTQVQYLAKLEKWPASELATFQGVHRMVVQRFSVMDAKDAAIDHEIQGARWTTRRVMRRLLAHEFEHLNHIKEILAAL